MGKTRIKIGVTGEPAIIVTLDGEFPDRKSSNFAYAIYDILQSAKISSDFISLTKGQALNYSVGTTEKKVVGLIEVYLIIPAQNPDGRVGQRPKSMNNIVLNLKSINSIMELPSDDPIFGSLCEVLDRMENKIQVVRADASSMPIPPRIKIPNPDGKHPKLSLLEK